MSKHDDGLSFIVVPNSGGAPRGISLSRRRIRVLAAGGTVAGGGDRPDGRDLGVDGPARGQRSDDLARQVDSLTIHQTRLNAVAEQLARVQARAGHQDAVVGAFRLGRFRLVGSGSQRRGSPKRSPAGRRDRVGTDHLAPHRRRSGDPGTLRGRRRGPPGDRYRGRDRLVRQGGGGRRGRPGGRRPGVRSLRPDRPRRRDANPLRPRVVPDRAEGMEGAPGRGDRAVGVDRRVYRSASALRDIEETGNRSTRSPWSRHRNPGEPVTHTRKAGQFMSKGRATQAATADKVISIIGPGMHIVGDCDTTDTIRIEGRIEGSVRAEKAVVVGEGGQRDRGHPDPGRRNRGHGQGSPGRGFPP